MSRILESYIGRLFLQCTAAALLFLLTVFLLIKFIDHVGDVGKHSFTVWHALQLSWLELQGLLHNMIPIAALIGSLVCLGILTNTGELLVIRCAGVTRLRVTLALLRYTLLLIFIQVVNTEFISPWTQQQISKLQAEKLQKFDTQKSSLWMRHGNTFTHIHRMQNEQEIAEIEVYELSDLKYLHTYLHAAKGTYNDTQWTLQDVFKAQPGINGVSAQTLPNAQWHTPVDAEGITPLLSKPRELSTFRLLHHLLHLHTIGADTRHYLQNLTDRLLQPLATILMVALAVLLIHPAARDIPSGRRVIQGCLLGIGWNVISNTSSNLGLVNHFSVVGSTLIPYLLLLAFIASRFYQDTSS